MHDKATSGRPINFTVEDAFPHLEAALGKCEIKGSFDLCITRENTQIPQSSLAFYLQRLASQRKQFVSNCDNEQNEFVFCWQK